MEPLKNSTSVAGCGQCGSRGEETDESTCFGIGFAAAFLVSAGVDQTHRTGPLQRSVGE